MATTNRGTRLTKLVAILKKKFKPTQPAERPLFESALYACLLENSTHAAAEEAIHHLESGYFDWNEVRVSTRTELAKALKPLNDPAAAADRLKRSLQSIFESVYMFDLEHFKKQNLGQSVKQFNSYDGVTPFVVSYVTQNGLSGHSIALNRGAIIAFHVLGLISDAELKKGVVPGLERAVPKNSAVGVGSIIHQLGVEIGRNPYSPAARKLLLSIDPSCKDRLPKRPKPKPEPPKPKAKPTAKTPAAKTPPAKGTPAKKISTKKSDTKAAPAAKITASKTAAPKKPAAKAKPAIKKKDQAKKAPAKKAPAKKAPAKKAAPKKAAKKKIVKKKATTNPKAASKKPAKKKAAAKKPATKKASPKKAAKKGAAKKVAKKKVAKKSAAASKKKRKPR